MAHINIAIIGLNRVSLSVALALNRYNASKGAAHKFTITLADDRVGVREEVVKARLADRVEGNVFNVARDKQIIVLGVPYADSEVMYQQLSSETMPGAVILDTALLKMPAIGWAKQYCNEETHLVGVTAIVNPKYLFDGADDALHAQADLFDKGRLLLMPSPGCVKEAVELASDFAGIIGAEPQFYDPAEHDSLTAGTELLPALLGVAAFHSLYKGHGWTDKQKLTNPAFGRLTHRLFDTHPDDLRDAFLHNRADLVRQLDGLMSTLGEFRTALNSGDSYALEAALVDAANEYDGWINRRFSGKWEEDTLPKAEPVSNMLLGNFLGGFFNKKGSKG